MQHTVTKQVHRNDEFMFGSPQHDDAYMAKHMLFLKLHIVAPTCDISRILPPAVIAVLHWILDMSKGYVVML